MLLNTILFYVLPLLFKPSNAQFPSSQFNLSPSSRSIKPISIYRTTGNVTNLNGHATIQYTTSDVFKLAGNASITYDFGQMVAGLPTLNIESSSCASILPYPSTGLPGFTCQVPLCQGLGLSFTEAVQYVGPESDESTLYNFNDGTLYIPIQKGSYTLADKWARGTIFVQVHGCTYVSHNFANLKYIRNVITENLVLQNKNILSPTYGYFPYAGSPLGNLFILLGTAYESDTYHLWTIAEFAEYVLTTKDITYGNQYWSQIITRISSTYKHIDTTTGLFNGTHTSDWGRIGQGGQNTALNALYYHTLTQLLRVAPLLNPISGVNTSKWSALASTIKTSANAHLYSPTLDLFNDNTTVSGSLIQPQDGNALAIAFSLTLTTQQAQTISKNLAARLTTYGAPAPELPNSISPFIGSHELHAHFIANPTDASPAMSNSTFIEGYSTTGTLSYGFYGNANSFISHAHSWSTGPVHSLLNYVVGIRAAAIDVDVGDGDWAFRPMAHGAGLTSADGGFKTDVGTFDASWNLTNTLFSATVSTPVGTAGTIYAPTLGRRGPKVMIDGKVAVGNSIRGFFRVPGVEGGVHRVVVIGA